MKPKIYATGNQNLNGKFNVSYYIFEKDSSFLEWLGKLLTEVLEIKGGERQAKFIIKEPHSEKEGEWTEEEIFIKDITKMIDLHEKYENKQGERVDVFYGKDRVYATLRKSKEIKQKFAEFIEKTKEWRVLKEVKNIPDYACRQMKVESKK